MRYSIAATVLSAAAVTAAPFKFPLPNGFPNPNATALAAIEKHAGGTLPNSGLPTKAKKPGITALQLIAFNEIFEVAYFTELLANITKAAPGYGTGGLQMPAEDVIFAIRAQEELHAVGANAILKSLGEQEIKPCKYDFPVDNIQDAIALAATFTDVVLGTLPVAQTLFAEDGGQETGLIKLLGSVLAQEGEQTGLYRVLQKKTPSAAPFLTGGDPNFAFTAINSFVVPGSCPNSHIIDLKDFKPLTVLSKLTAKSKTARFSIDGSGVSASKNSLVYISGQNIPVTVPITKVATSKGKTTFEAKFPFENGAKSFAHGLTIAAVVSGTGKTFSDPSAVAASAVYGPGLIEVD